MGTLRFDYIINILVVIFDIVLENAKNIFLQDDHVITVENTTKTVKVLKITVTRVLVLMEQLGVRRSFVVSNLIHILQKKKTVEVYPKKTEIVTEFKEF